MKNPQAPGGRGEANNELPQVQPYLQVSLVLLRELEL